VIGRIFPETGIVVQTLPKVSLQDQRDSGLLPGAILEPADAAGVAVPKESDTGQPIDAAGRHTQWFADQADSASREEHFKTLNGNLSALQIREGLHRIA